MMSGMAGLSVAGAMAASARDAGRGGLCRLAWELWAGRPALVRGAGLLLQPMAPPLPVRRPALGLAGRRVRSSSR